ncbi:hypothetical protein [Sphingobium sp. YR768]|uniref:hypothetical protein n=1 Tax=Sphingobium sp. YR768 TaxID=1884365 RepID=UPI0008B6609E|nr:hypothetical protein [Sphingobium sp. YR768]SES07879.1 hypothetical protein SAMN05518866_1374 [Sphingobium sp. YR768]
MNFNSVNVHIRKIENGFVGHVSVQHGVGYSRSETGETYFNGLVQALAVLNAIAANPEKVIADHPVSNEPDF